MRAVLAGLFLGSTVAGVAPDTFTGVIIDAECAGAGHAVMRMAPTDAECARACVLSHDSAYQLEVGAKVYGLSDQKAAERLAAQKVVVLGTLDERTKTIQVESITTAQ